MPESVQDAWVLPNGNILLSGGSDAREMTRSKDIVWKYTASTGEIHNCEPLPDNVDLFGENSSGKLSGRYKPHVNEITILVSGWFEKHGTVPI